MKLSTFTILLIILFATIPVRSQISSFTYEENTEPILFSMESYEDNSIVVNIVSVNKSDPSNKNTNELCVNKYLSFRTILPDGRVEPVDLTLDIQDLNFCIRVIDDEVYNPIRIYAVKDKFVLVTYTEVTDFDDPTTYDDRAMWMPNFAKLIYNVDRDKGFLRLGGITNATDAVWQQFIITELGEIKLLAEDVISFPEDTAILKPVAMMDGGYAIIYANTTNSKVNPNEPTGEIAAKLLPYGKKSNRQPVVLYENQIQGLQFNGLDCRAVYNIQSLNATIPNNPGVDHYNIRSLPYGGFLLDGKGVNFIVGYIFNDTEIYDWGLNNPVMSNIQNANLILPNNTFVLAQPEGTKNWGLSSTNLYKFDGELDHGYGNLHINTTTPLINEIIPYDIDSLIIHYHSPIELSKSNIIIFQYDRNIVRQNISGSNNEYVTLDENGTTVNVKIINSTFNRPGERYYVLIENDFVMSQEYQEPLLGLQNKDWFFTTNIEDEKNSDKIAGRVRLTVNGTALFESLDKVGRNDFYTKLRHELAYAIPISQDRITTNGRVETDHSVSPNQIILSIIIEKDKYGQERTVDLAAKDLNTLINHKPITFIASGEISKYLDSGYGYQRSPNLLEVYTFEIIAVFVILIVSVGLFFYARKCNSEQEMFKEYLFQAGADIEALYLLESKVKIRELDFFKAQFSNDALKSIQLGAWVHIFTEDIPQVIIQCIL
ncbi:1493_t:CDS:10 [Funneliformis mosseae]|uniref:1493_t:CDS:1 n=1 Tax=Funneliformis mosseae TaxID=27381 RepID=A0A9N9H050_FUNMO|nr:1493_t:CDS:10 [Funneliformis mosseae]